MPIRCAAAAQATASLVLEPIKKIEGTVTLPGSKSLSNRTLLLAALAEGTTVLENVLDSEDIRYMVSALEQLNVGLEVDWPARRIVVRGCGGRFDSPGGELFLGNAGTAMRPLTAAVAAAGRGTFVLDGVARMRERPIEDLVSGLRQLGVEASCTLGTQCPPVRVEARGLRPGRVELSGAVSSQYLTALLMAAPLIAITDELISAPYVAMTIQLMARFGVRVEERAPGLRLLHVPGAQRYRSPGTAFGDVAFAEVLRRMGARVEWQARSITVQGPPRGELRAVDESCVDIPDAAMTLAVAALFARGTTVIRDVGSWRVKETERMKAIVAELTKLGADVVEGADSCTITPPPALRAAAIETYDDHRMAMAFSLAACGDQPITILDPGCTRKTFPNYFEVLESVTHR
ncbi:hypothetical protein QBZ16_004067 [Prototheca wickerhamii]|uniref:3-phosphoshikimate 1-carboxyvinyltransferase n=1 Tax=Prototheca wickerhamii TaxID=3111 RepID=A0AAD9IGS0_PROWI|nr:hypothetical protein QBZ16_004067 [Prototheca wickerhamii]